MKYFCQLNLPIDKSWVLDSVKLEINHIKPKLIGPFDIPVGYNVELIGHNIKHPITFNMKNTSTYAWTIDIKHEKGYSYKKWFYSRSSKSLKLDRLCRFLNRYVGELLKDIKNED